MRTYSHGIRIDRQECQCWTPERSGQRREDGSEFLMELTKFNSPKLVDGLSNSRKSDSIPSRLTNPSLAALKRGYRMVRRVCRAAATCTPDVSRASLPMF